MKRLLNHSDGLLRAGRSVWFQSVLRAAGVLPPELQRGSVGGAFSYESTMPSPWLGITVHGSASLRLDQLGSALRSVNSFDKAAGQRQTQQHVLVVENATDLSAFQHTVLDHAKRVAASVRNGRVVIVVLDERKGGVSSSPLPYAAVFPAIEGFTRSLAKELGGNGTTVNTLMVRGSSSSLDAAMKGPLRAQLFQPLSFFLAPDAAFVSGQTVVLQLDRLLEGSGLSGSGSPAQATQAALASETRPAANGGPDKGLRFLSGRVAVVTGAARGIGAAIAARLAAEGATVVGVDVPAASDALAATMRSIVESSAAAPSTAAATAPTTVPLAMDITQADAPARLHEALLQLQARRVAASASASAPAAAPRPLLHIMVHNAGVTRDRMLRAMDAGRWGDVQAVNLEAVLRINRQLLGLGLGLGHGAGQGAESCSSSSSSSVPSHAPVLCPVHGRVISLSSINGIAGARGQTNYAWTKGALIGYTEALGEELRARYPLAAARLPSPWPAGAAVDRPSAFAVAPGFIETAMVAQMPFVIRSIGRRSNALLQGGLPEDVAAAVAFLCLPGAAAASGSTLRVCGGNMVGK